MREIKFRVWDRKLNAMFPIHDMRFGKIDNQLSFVHGVDIHDKDSDSSGDVSYGGSVHKMTGTPLQPRFEIMQFIELIDKYGKEVYEGDVLKNAISDGLLNWLVESGDGGYKVVNIGTDGYLGERYPLKQSELHDRMIIGNVYANPELLELARSAPEPNESA